MGGQGIKVRAPSKPPQSSLRGNQRRAGWPGGRGGRGGRPDLPLDRHAHRPRLLCVIKGSGRHGVLSPVPNRAGRRVPPPELQSGRPQKAQPIQIDFASKQHETGSLPTHRWAPSFRRNQLSRELLICLNRGLKLAPARGLPTRTVLKPAATLGEVAGSSLPRPAPWSPVAAERTLPSCWPGATLQKFATLTQHLGLY